MNRSKVFLLGKLPPPFIGPAIATQHLLQSSLVQQYGITHFNTGLNADVREMGKLSLAKLPRILTSYRQYWLALRKYKPMLIHVPISQTTVGFWKDAPYLLLGASKGRRVLVHLRGSDFQRWFRSQSRLHQSLVRWVLARCAGAIVLGQSLRGLFSDFFPDHHIHVVPNGANIPVVARKPNASAFTFVSVSNLLPGKGIDLVIEALAQLRAQTNKPVMLIAAGAWDNPQFENHCRQLVQRLGLEDCVQFAGSVYNESKWALLARADVFVFTPRSPEGLPWSLVEAAAYSLPMISTRQGAIADVVHHNETGALCEPNPQAIAAAMLRYVEDGVRVQKHGLAARKHYEQHFSQAAMEKALAKVYDYYLEQACVE